MGILIPLALVGVCIFYPKLAIQWFASLIVAFVAAYFTVAQANWIAPFWPFILWFTADYILMQVIFAFLNRKKKKVLTPNGAANDNGKKC